MAKDWSKAWDKALDIVESRKQEEVIGLMKHDHKKLNKMIDILASGIIDCYPCVCVDDCRLGANAHTEACKQARIAYAEKKAGESE